MPAGVVPIVVAMLRLDVPDPITEAGVKVGVAPAGNPLTLKLTVPAYPLIAVTVAVKLAVSPIEIPTFAGEALRLKSTGFTTSVTDAVWVNTPSVPLIVRLYVPAGVVLAVLMASDDVPVPVTDAGVKVGVAPAGRPLTLRLTVPV